MNLYSEKNKRMAVSEFVYNELKEEIISLKLKPGEKISEQEVSDLLQVSRSPVRETFIRLAGEELLDIRPQRGTFISKINLSHVEEGRFIRMSLECSVLKLAIEMGISAELKEIDKNLRLQEETVNDKDINHFFELDEEFHRILFQACNKKMTWYFLNNINTQYKRVRHLSLLLTQTPEQIIDQHRKYIEVIAERRFDRIDEIVKDHLYYMIQNLDLIKEKFSDYVI